MRREILLSFALAALASACGTIPAARDTPNPSPALEIGPPLTDGLYVVPGACPGEGCQLGAWIATRAGDLRERPDQNAPIVAHVASGEHVEAIASVLRLKPVRGEVVRADQGLQVGDVVYRLDSQGEGFFDLWRRGEILTWSWPSSAEDEAAIRWDAAEDEARNPFAGWWVQIRGPRGQTGWTRERGFECRPIPSDPAHCQLM